MIYSIYGFGKFKTEASIGMAIRANANGEKVLYCQFLKDGKSSEVSTLESLGVACMSSEYKGVSLPNEDDIRIENTLLTSTKFNQEYAKYDLIILDEVLVCIDNGYISFDKLKDFVDSVGCDVCLTGRIRSHDMRKKIAKLSDICSNSFCVKHSYNTYCEKCNQEYKYHYKHCPQCGDKLKYSKPARKGRDY